MACDLSEIIRDLYLHHHHVLLGLHQAVRDHGQGKVLVWLHDGAQGTAAGDLWLVSWDNQGLWLADIRLWTRPRPLTAPQSGPGWPLMRCSSMMSSMGSISRSQVREDMRTIITQDYKKIFQGRDTVRVNSFLEKAWDPDPQVIIKISNWCVFYNNLLSLGDQTALQTCPHLYLRKHSFENLKNILILNYIDTKIKSNFNWWGDPTK